MAVVIAGNVSPVPAIKHEYEVLNRFSTQIHRKIEVVTDSDHHTTKVKEAHIIISTPISDTKSHSVSTAKITFSDRTTFSKAPATKAEKMNRFTTIKKEILASKEATIQFMKDAGLID